MSVCVSRVKINKNLAFCTFGVLLLYLCLILLYVCHAGTSIPASTVDL